MKQNFLKIHLFMSTASILRSLAVISAFAVSSICHLSAQEDLYGNTGAIPERMIVLQGDSADLGGELVAIVYDTKDLHFQDPRAPRFLFIDRQGNTALGIGGYIEGIAQYDFNGAIDGNSFTTFDIPVPRDASLHNRLGADATHSTIFLRLVRQTKLGPLSAYIQTNFSGDGGGYGVKVKQAYIRVGGFTAGLTNSTFADPSAGVPTIDYQGPSGSIGGKNLIFQYIHKFSGHWTGAISVENPEATYTVADGKCEEINQRVPDIPAYIQYQWGSGKDHIRLSGIFRDLSYRDLVSGKNRFTTGWGVQLSTVFSPVNLITVYGQAAYGKGIARYVNDLSGFGYDLISAGDGTMESPEDLGIVAGIQLNVSKSLFFSGSYSLNRAYGTSDNGPLAYQRANYVVVNGFYTFGDNFQVGLEYLYGNRYDVNHLHNHANRLEAMMKFSF